jgi:biotin biosynthesis protein bioC
MQINPKLIKNQFEKSLDTYNKNAVVQQIMAEKLVEETAKIKTDYDNILELGSGAGLLTKELIKKLYFKTYSANDLVEKSKSYISEIIPDTVFYCGNAQRIKPSKKMDLIISNAMFQWFKDLEKVSSVYKNLLNKGGILAFSTFSPENFKEIRALTGLTLDYKSLQEIKNIFAKNYEVIYLEEFTHTLSFTTPLELLAHMKNTGVNSLTAQHWTFKEVKDFCDKYKALYPNISLTYSPIIVICKKI